MKYLNYKEFVALLNLTWRDVCSLICKKLMQRGVEKKDLEKVAEQTGVLLVPGTTGYQAMKIVNQTIFYALCGGFLWFVLHITHKIIFYFFNPSVVMCWIFYVIIVLKSAFFMFFYLNFPTYKEKFWRERELEFGDWVKKHKMLNELITKYPDHMQNILSDLKQAYQ